MEKNIQRKLVKPVVQEESQQELLKIFIDELKGWINDSNFMKRRILAKKILKKFTIIRNKSKTQKD